MTALAATLIIVSAFAVTSCTGSDGTDDDSPSIGGIKARRSSIRRSIHSPPIRLRRRATDGG